MSLLALAAADAAFDSPFTLDDTDDDDALTLWLGGAVLSGLTTILALLRVRFSSEPRPPLLQPPQLLPAN